ncbi:hypothetical protein L9F63_000419, partial [Diploptera punctata]
YSALVRFEIAEMLSAVCLLTAYIKQPLLLNIHIGNTVIKTSRPENQWLQLMSHVMDDHGYQQKQCS